MTGSQYISHMTSHNECSRVVYVLPVEFTKQCNVCLYNITRCSKCVSRILLGRYFWLLLVFGALEGVGGGREGGREGEREGGREGERGRVGERERGINYS